MHAEKCLDAIIHSFAVAKRNQQNDWHINESDQAGVIHYYKRYWDNDFVNLALFILLVSFICAFYTKLALIGIFAVFLAKLSYSQSAFMKYFANDHNLNTSDKEEIKDKIFGSQLDTKTVAMITVALSVLSYMVSFISRPIFFNSNDESSLFVVIIKSLKLDFSNELFAYSVAISIFALLFLKIFEKWR